MADWNKVLTPGDWENGQINVVIEIPRGGNQKIEWDRKLGLFKLDRLDPASFPKPTNYGFIPQTLDEDGDELDVLLICETPLQTGVFTQAKVLGVMQFVDDGEVDDKIIAILADDREHGDLYQSLADLPKGLLSQIEYHFNHYKDLKKPGTTEVKSFDGAEVAKEVIKAAIERWDEQAKPRA